MRKENFQTDFLLTDTPTTHIQFIGLLVLGINLIAAGVIIWVVFLVPLVASMQIFQILCFVIGSGVCGFFVYWGYLNLHRAFVGKFRKASPQKGQS